jgi:hypothetical protein
MKTLIQGFLIIIKFISTVWSELKWIASRNIIIIIALLVIYTITWIADQGQDLLITLNDSDHGPFTLYLTIITLALLNWHFPKIINALSVISDKKESALKKLKELEYTDGQRSKINFLLNLPRLLGVVTLLIRALGFINSVRV